jgi:hypothetical protein
VGENKLWRTKINWSVFAAATKLAETPITPKLTEQHSSSLSRPGHYYLELLSHYTKWSFLPRIGISVAAILFAQYVAGRFRNRGQRKHVN